MPEETKLTAGEIAVGLSFNPSGDEKVNKLKKLFAEAFDIVGSNFPSNDKNVGIAMRDSALEAIITAQMWAVKVATLKY